MHRVPCETLRRFFATLDGARTIPNCENFSLQKLEV